MGGGRFCAEGAPARTAGAIIARMWIKQILSTIDAEIARLMRVRSLMARLDKLLPVQSKKLQPADGKPAGKKRHWTADGRERLRKATKRRWREMKKAGVKTPHLAKVK